MNKRIPFKKGEVELFARFVCELIRQGCTFNVYSDDVGWEVEMTGGF